MTGPNPAGPNPSRPNPPRQNPPRPDGAAGPGPVEALTRELDAITPWVRWWLRAEGVFAVALGAYVWLVLRHNGDWPWFLVGLLLPDLSMAGYLAGNHVGAITYNLAHNWFVGGLVLGCGLVLGNDALALVGALLVAHTGVDRVMGYGLKYPTGFGDTHLGRIGKRR